MKPQQRSHKGNQILIRNMPPGFRDDFKKKCDERGLKMNSILIKLMSAWMKGLKAPELNVTSSD